MSSVVIGQKNAQAVTLSKQYRATHMHVMGASGAGKSYFLEHLIRRDIIAGRGVCVIDPHGELYDNLIDWMVRSNIRRHQLHLINPTDETSTVGYNPLCVENRTPMARVNNMISAFERVWGSSMDTTARLEKCLRMTLYPLAVHKLSLLEANIFTAHKNKEFRQRLLDELPDSDIDNSIRREWEEFESYRDREFREYFESTRTRIFKFISSSVMIPIIGQTENNLDFKKCMDNGHVVLVNLKASGDVHPNETQLLGALIIAEMFGSARMRDKETAEREPFYTYIDECADYINEDIAKSLDQTRKFGLHYILSHQRLNQLLNAGKEIYDAVMVNAQTKVIFRIDDDETAETLCKQLFRSEISLERPKEIMNKPVAVGQEIIDLYGESTTATNSESRSVGSSNSYSDSSGTSTFVPTEGDEAGVTETDGSGSTETYSESSAISRAESSTKSRAQALRTIYEVRPTELYTIDEQMHLGIVAIRELPSRQAIVKLPGMKAKRIQTIDIKTRKALSVQREPFVRLAHKNSQFSSPKYEIRKQIDERERLLIAAPDVIEKDYDPESFMN